MIKIDNPKKLKLGLNIGCGNNTKNDEKVKWINIDIRKLKNVDYIMDATKLDFENNIFDFVYSAHVLEHFSHQHTQTIVNEWVRVLKKNGELFIAVPDILKISKAFINADIGIDMVIKYFYGGQGYDSNFHKAGFCFSLMKKIMRNSGLKDIEFWKGTREDASGSFYSLNIKGVKK